MEKKIIKDLARRLAYYQVKESTADHNDVRQHLHLLIRSLPLMRVVGYVPTYNEIDPSVLTHYTVRRNLESAIAAVKAIKGILLVPLRGFNSNNHRLGFGGGFYDQLIAEARPTLTIGIGLEANHVEFIPEEHDMRMDYIVTEKGIRQ